MERIRKMIQLAAKADSLAAAEQMLAESLDNGQARAKFLEWITAQGGAKSQLENPDTLPTTPIVQEIAAPNATSWSDAPVQVSPHIIKIIEQARHWG